MPRRVLTLLLALGLLAAAAPQTALALGWRGIVEGAYGRPWSDDERAAMLRWMARHGMNAYVHAPKDDLYGRTHWRDPYPAAQQAVFDAEVRRARADGVAWIPNISPALPLIPTVAAPAGAPSRDLCFSCPGDLQVVRRKFAPFVAAGARAVMVSFDDVSKVMSHPEDAARFGAGDEAFGRANGEFLSRLARSYREDGSGVRVLSVGADYQGTADTAYLRGLRATLDPGIDVMWTGTNVPSEDFTEADARAYAAHIGRRPVLWDNWTNTDTAGSAAGDAAARIFLGPYRRRPGVAARLDGVFLNVANDAHLNKLPIATAADWLAAPAAYDPAASWRRAVRALAGARAAGDLRAWAETSWSNRLDRTTEAPTFVRRARAFTDAYDREATWPARHASLAAELERVERAPGTLARMRDRDVARQAAPFLAAARRGARAGALGADLLAAERPALAVRRTRRGFAGRAAPPDPAAAARLRAEAQAARTAFETDRRFTYGWRLPYAFDVPPYEVPRNVMSAFLDEVRERDAAWAPAAATAASEVTLRLDGRRVPLSGEGGFNLPRSACGGLLEARDGAGGRTAVRLARCRAA
jgi:hyaluronoglucosaminidase